MEIGSQGNECYYELAAQNYLSGYSSLVCQDVP